jgi:hypothetical protein
MKMTTSFKRHELPIAYSMIDAANRVRPRRDGRHPFDKFFLLWTAFNDIYNVIAARAGLSTQLMLGEDGKVETYTNGNATIPKVIPVSESEQINLAVQELDSKLKHTLIMHESTHFFLSRTPYWQGKPIEMDAFGQKLNGVLNVNHTTRADYPVWSPIDRQIYDTYLANPDNDKDRTFLVGQIVNLLHTVRLNLVHFSKSFDDGNDIAVAQNALPLLEIIVGSFIQ